MTEDRDRASVEAARYWDAAAEGARFSHPLDASSFTRHVPRGAAVLDLGCGYGRLTRTLVDLGYRRTIGLDPSQAMLERARREQPDLELQLGDGLALPFADGVFGAVVAMAVFTSVPESERQAALLDEIERVLAPRGVLLVSDLPLQDGERERTRYAAAFERGADHGVFEHESGTRFRHHDEGWFEALERRFERLDGREVAVATMTGKGARARQVLLRRR